MNVYNNVFNFDIFSSCIYEIINDIKMIVKCIMCLWLSG